MSKIKSGKIIEKEETNDKKGLYIFLTLIIVTFLLIGGSMWYKQYHQQKINEENAYNGFLFYEQYGLWFTTLSINNQAYNIPFYYHPRDLKDVYIEKNIELLIRNPEKKPDAIYITVDPESNSRIVVGGVEISRITGYKYKLLNIFTKAALQYNNDNSTDTLIVTCNDAKKDIIVLYYTKGPNNAIFRNPDNPYCIMMQYKDDESAIKISDRLAYQLLMIMD